MTNATMRDLSSHAYPDEAKVTDLDWTASIDFSSQTITAVAKLTVQHTANRVRLDVKDLVIRKILVVDGSTSTSASYSVHPLEKGKDHLGQCLEVELQSSNNGRSASASTSTSVVEIHYQTTEECSAAQWLPASQTAGKVHPYFFTQCQAIHARSLVPCQDCPGSKMTYKASVTVPSWSTCLMSALSKGSTKNDDETTTFFFDQPIPVPAYLIAVVVGELSGIDVSHRCKVWSEPSVVEAAAFEFSQTEDFLKIAEDLTFEYQWGRYDVLCLPPSFPYGGMENPCLTFVTPTLLAGDKSLADVVAHEIAHSWTGNLVTNETWAHFWLNEGWTTWLQRKIMAKIAEDKRVVDFDAIGGWEDLKESVELVSENFSRLVPDLGDDDPDEAYSSVPYEKGFNLLYNLEKRVGSEKFGSFAKAYLHKFKFSTCTSEEFRAFFQNYFEGDTSVESFDWNTWLYKGGMPPESPEFDRSLSEAAFELATSWVEFDDSVSASKPDLDISKWSSNMKTCFLDALLALCDGKNQYLKISSISAMNELYKFDKSKNSEILFRWCKMCIESGKCPRTYILKFYKERK